jgi:hypothetical protein
MSYVNPLPEQAVTDPEDLALVVRVQAGSREALETLLTRHQTWIYNIKRRGPDTISFSEYARGLDNTADLDLPDPSSVPVHAAPDFLAALRKLLDSPECRSLLAR